MQRLTTVSKVVAACARLLCLIGIGLGGTAACGRHEGAFISKPSSGGPIRLVDVLPLARVEPPPTSAEADLSETPFEAVWRWDPETGELPDVHSGSCGMERDEEGAPRLVCDGETVLRAAVPDSRAGHHRVRIRAGPERNAECFQVRWFEGEQLLGRAALDSLATATEGVYELDTHLSGDAATLYLAIRGIPRVRNVRRGCELALYGLEVDWAESSPEVLFARIRDTEALGLSGHPLAVGGYFLPRPPGAVAEAPYDENHSYREGILAPPPRRLVFPIELPTDARLALSLGLHRASVSGSGARFTVLVRADDLSSTLLNERISAGDGALYWRERRLDLAAWSGRRVELVLETTPVGTDGAIPVWGVPRIDYPRTPEDPPSVLLLAVDTLRADRLAPYGGPPTPALSGLASEGVVFERAIAEANHTLASFTSLLTGASPARHRVLQPLDVLPRRFRTVAEDFRTAGWVTEAILIKPMLAAGRDLERGFERYYNLPQLDPRGDRTLGKAVEWIEDNGDRRFFLFLHFDDPHLPYTQPERWVPRETLETLARLGIELPFPEQPRDLLRTCESCRDSRSARAEFEEATRSLYDSEVAYVDEQIRLLFTRLRELGLWDDLLVVFVSDHGELLWDSAAPGAASRYGHSGEDHPDELVRVPLIVKPPANWRLERGSRVAQPVSLVDVAATLTELAGGVAHGDGRSLVRILRGDSAESLPPRPMFSFAYAGESSRWGGWHYSRRYQDAMRPEEWVVAADRGEKVSEASAAPLGELRARMADHVLSTGSGWVALAVRAQAGRRLSLRVGTQVPCGDMRDLAFPPYGMRWACRDGLWQAEGEADAALPVVFGLHESDGQRVSVELALEGVPFARRRVEVGNLSEYSPGRLVKWLAEGGEPELMLARVPRAVEPSGEPTDSTIDDDQLDTLRALGYID